MKPTALMVCKGLIPEEREGVLVPLLSRGDQVVFQQLPSPRKGEIISRPLLNHIHFSWIAPYLRTLTETEVRSFLAVLTPKQASGLQKTLGLENHLPPLPSVSKRGLQQLLLSHILHGKDLVPLSFLPEHPLNRLLELPSEGIEKLILYLGLHDLSFEMRQIIDTKELKKIFDVLTKRESEFLNQLMLHKEPLVFKRLFLNKWDGTKETLHKLLEERGANRIGHILYSASESLAWYLTHSVDMHIGTNILKHIEKPSHSKAEEILLKQIDQILHFFKPGESA